MPFVAPLRHAYSESDLNTRIFLIGNPIHDNDKIIDESELKEWFSIRGVEFPQGSRVEYANGKRHILSHNSVNNQKLIEGIIDLESSLERTLEIYSVFIERSGGSESIDVAAMIVEEGWFTWATTYGAAKVLLEHPEEKQITIQFEKSLSNLLRFMLSEIETHE